MPDAQKEGKNDAKKYRGKQQHRQGCGNIPMIAVTCPCRRDP